MLHARTGERVGRGRGSWNIPKHLHGQKRQGKGVLMRGYAHEIQNHPGRTHRGTECCLYEGAKIP